MINWQLCRLLIYLVPWSGLTVLHRPLSSSVRSEVATWVLWWMKTCTTTILFYFIFKWVEIPINIYVPMYMWVKFKLVAVRFIWAAVYWAIWIFMWVESPINIHYLWCGWIQVVLCIYEVVNPLCNFIFVFGLVLIYQAWYHKVHVNWGILCNVRQQLKLIWHWGECFKARVGTHCCAHFERARCILVWVWPILAEPLF